MTHNPAQTVDPLTVFVPSIEQFMRDPQPDEDEVTPAQDADPLASIADSLSTLVQIAQGRDGDESALHDAVEAHADLSAEHAQLQGLVEEIEALIKPSTSKLANSVRLAISAWRTGDATQQPDEAPVEAAPEPTEPERAVAIDGPGGAPVQPAHDAPVEEWRRYARALGYQGPDIDAANRSQIRTMLGIAQVPA